MGPTEWGPCTHIVTCPGLTCTLAYWNNTVATSPTECDIITYDTLTGSQTAILSGHAGYADSLAFSLDGTLLVSGSWDKTVKLWDVQTGGIIRTSYSHTDLVYSVAISSDNTMVALGSYNCTIHLWDIKTGNCCIMEGHKECATVVTFSPTNPQLLLSSSSDNTIQHWSTNGHQIGLPIPGYYVAFSPDGTQFASCKGKAITIRNTNSRMIVVEFNLATDAYHCCFSPNGKYIAVAGSQTIYLWDITGHNPYIIQTFIGHTDIVSSLVFSSSLTLISASDDRTVRFWQIGTLSGNLAIPSLEPTPLTSTSIESVSLQTKDGLAFSIDSEGVVKTWDILTGCCKESCKTQAKNIKYADIQLIRDGLIIVGYCYVQILKESRHGWEQKVGGLGARPADSY